MPGFLVCDERVRAALTRSAYPSAGFDAVVRRLVSSADVTDLATVLVSTEHGPGRLTIGSTLRSVRSGTKLGMTLPASHHPRPETLVKRLAESRQTHHLTSLEWRAHYAPRHGARDVDGKLLADGVAATLAQGLHPIVSILPRHKADNDTRRVTERAVAQMDACFAARDINWSDISVRVDHVSASPEVLGPAWGPRGVAALAISIDPLAIDSSAERLTAIAAISGAPHVTFSCGTALVQLIRQLADPFDLDQIEEAVLHLCRPLAQAGSPVSAAGG